MLEQDVLWKNEYADSAEALTAYRRTWLRVAMNIAQGGRSTVLLGTVLPEHYENQPERRFFTGIHYLALVCREEELERRLRARPAWRGYDDEKVERMLSFNNWLLENAQTTTPPMAVLDTTRDSVEETVRSVVAWVRSNADSSSETRAQERDEEGSPLPAYAARRRGSEEVADFTSSL